MLGIVLLLIIYAYVNKKYEDKKMLEKFGITLLIHVFFPFSLIYLVLKHAEKVKYEERKRQYEETSYFFVTHTPYSQIVSNGNGAGGEYRLYKALCFLEKMDAKLLFNLYIPKEDGNTTEIDMVCVCNKGIFVFECKDYSGWIFGSENQREWVQTLRGKYGESNKYHFYNPVLQNKEHIRYLRNVLKIGKEFPIWSIIVFSNHCELKKIDVKKEDVFVIQQRDVSQTVKNLIDNMPDVIGEHEKNVICGFLYPLTQVNEQVKDRHNGYVREVNMKVHR